MGVRSEGRPALIRHQPADIEFLGQVAAWYYEDGLSQEEIAARIGKSRSMVSRFLQSARELGLVSVRVRFPLRTVAALETELVDRFNLTEAHVLKDPRMNGEVTLARLGRLAARNLQKRLFSGVRISIGWGQSLNQLVRSMPEIQLDSVMVVQMMGSIGESAPYFDGAELARQLADKLNGDFRVLSAPLIVDSEATASGLLGNRAIRRTLDAARRSDMLLSGLGSIDRRSSGLSRAGYLDSDRLRAIEDLGAVGDFMGFMLDSSGQLLDISENRRIIAMSPASLSSIPWVLGVAGGAAKAGVVGAALRAGYLDALVTDSTAAELVLAQPVTRQEASG